MHEGERFLHQRTPTLHTSKPVEHEQNRRKLAGEPVHDKPADKLADWMMVLERTHTGHRDDPRVLDRIRDYYHDTYVITADAVPESSFENQQRIARERGHGDIELTDDMRAQLTEALITDQNTTLDLWLDYLTSPDSDSFPMWAKYWAFTGMVKLSSYDKEKHTFGTRDKGTVAPFPDLNREALAVAVDAIMRQAHREQIPPELDNPRFKALLAGGNFGKLYAYAIEEVTPTHENALEQTAGEWVTYPRGSDHMPLVRSLQGHATGWCTAGESTAHAQLQGGDFHVYYSYDAHGQPTVPRVAVRMEDTRIAEVRGIAADQNLDPYIGPVVEEKLAAFGAEGEHYTKRAHDMERLTDIDRRAHANSDLTTDDLRFLYEIDAPIQGFGYQKDPRIQELLAGREVKKDLAFLLGCTPREISTTRDEALSGGIVYHYGDLNLSNLTSADDLTLPQSVGGYLNLSNLTSADGLTLPQSVGGGLDLSDLTSAEGLTLPQSVGGVIILSGLSDVEFWQLRVQYPQHCLER